MFIACTRPLLAVKTGINPETGKPQYKVNPYSRIPANPAKGEINIPCGQCMECRLQYARNWADRCMLEASLHEHNLFLTLTYDDDHVPRSYNDVGTEVLSLAKVDLQKFFKRLRTDISRAYRGLKISKRSLILSERTIRYFACGEYGDHTFRPHYHAIVFGLDVDDLVFDHVSKSGNNLYVSKTLDDIWTLGNVFVGDVSWNSCAYVARYVTKKQKGFTADSYIQLGIEPEFVLMSRRPGIASGYYDKHKSMYEYDAVHIPTPDGGVRVKPPRYFDKRLEAENPEKMAEVRERRELVGKIAHSMALTGTDLDEFDYFGVLEKSSFDRTKIFKREVI